LADGNQGRDSREPGTEEDHLAEQANETKFYVWDEEFGPASSRSGPFPYLIKVWLNGHRHAGFANRICSKAAIEDT
jgi:hypothetical protein